jgi:hypothetical protein
LPTCLLQQLPGITRWIWLVALDPLLPSDSNDPHGEPNPLPRPASALLAGGYPVLSYDTRGDPAALLNINPLLPRPGADSHGVAVTFSEPFSCCFGLLNDEGVDGAGDEACAAGAAA